MTKQLTVHNAEVRTAAVEVRSLTISGKQVTLAVFRQLMEENPLNDEGQWKGIPWGFVNYLNDDVGKRHVVWQDGIELRRGLVDSRIPNWHDLEGGEWLAAAVDNGWRSQEWLDYRTKFFATKERHPNIHQAFAYNVFRRRDERLDVRVQLAGADPWYLEANYDQQSLKCLANPDPTTSSHRYSPDDLTRIKDGLYAQVKQRENYRTERAKRWMETLALDQLFIAV